MPARTRGWGASEAVSGMDEDLLRRLPEEYARLADRRGVMGEAAEVVAELHATVTRLGDAIAAAGLPARVWRSPEADLRLLADRLPDMTVDALISRLSEFAAGTGPDWLHGDRAALRQFHEEAANLDALMRALRVAAQRLRLAPAHERGDLPIEVAFCHVRVVAAIEQVSLALGDLVALAPFMGPLTAEQWASLSPLEPAGATGADAEGEPRLVLDQLGPAASVSAASPLAASPLVQPAPGTATTLRLRDYARTAPLNPRAISARQTVAVPRSLRLVADLTEPLQRGVRALARVVRMPARLVAVLGLILLLAAGAGVLELAHVDQAQPASAAGATLLVSPSRLTLACVPGRSATLTLKNATTGALSWSARVPTGLTISPAHGTLAVGKTVSLRVAVMSTHLKSGTISITTSHGTVAVPYTTTCK